MPEQVIVLGAGGHGKVVADAILSAGDTVLGFLDDDPDRNAVWDIPVLGPFGAWESWADRAVFVFGLGNNALRRELSGQMQVKWHTAVHPAARVGRGVVLGLAVGWGVGSGVTVGAGVGVAPASCWFT